MKRKAKDFPECPVATTVQLVGSKWKLLIIRNLMARPWRFNELQRNLGVTQKSLTDALRSLEEDGLVARKVYPEIPPKVEYSMTELGKSLWPTIEAMQKFGEYYKEQL